MDRCGGSIERVVDALAEAPDYPKEGAAGGSSSGAPAKDPADYYNASKFDEARADEANASHSKRSE